MIAGLSVPAWPPKTARRASRESNTEAASGKTKSIVIYFAMSFSSFSARTLTLL